MCRPDRQAEKGRRRKSGNSNTAAVTAESPVNPKQWKHDCNELLNQMVENKNSEPFRLAFTSLFLFFRNLIP